MILSNLLFGDNSNKTDYKQAAYDKYYSDISRDTYDTAYGGMKDYLDQYYDGGADRYKIDTLTGLEKNAKNSLSNYNATKNDVFGNGLIGNILNPIAQVVGGVSDLAGMGLSGGKYNAWDSSKDPLGVHRDIGSDLGALGETALTVVPMARGASLAKAGKAMKAGTATAKQAARVAASQVPKTMGQKIAGGTLLGAGFGATGSLRDMGFENFDPNQFALSTAIGGGIGGVGAGIGGLWNKYTSSRVPTTTADTTPYQTALNNLKKNAGTGGMYSDVMTNLPSTGGLDTARVTLDNLNEDTLKKLFRSGVKKARSSAIGEDTNALTSSLTNDKNLLQEFLKNGAKTNTTYTTQKAGSLGEALKNLRGNVANTKAGTKISNLLKTKRGKVMAGAGGGLLLAQLLRNNNSNPDELSEEELNELYNYVYGGQ